MGRKKARSREVLTSEFLGLVKLFPRNHFFIRKNLYVSGQTMNRLVVDLKEKEYIRELDKEWLEERYYRLTEKGLKHLEGKK